MCKQLQEAFSKHNIQVFIKSEQSVFVSAVHAKEDIEAIALAEEINGLTISLIPCCAVAMYLVELASEQNK